MWACGMGQGELSRKAGSKQDVPRETRRKPQLKNTQLFRRAAAAGGGRAGSGQCRLARPAAAVSVFGQLFGAAGGKAGKGGPTRPPPPPPGGHPEALEHRGDAK